MRSIGRVGLALCAALWMAPSAPAQEQAGADPLPSLLQELTADVPERARRAGRDLAALGDAVAPAAPQLVQLLSHENVVTRSVAYETLARLGAPATPALLEEFVRLNRGKDTAAERAWVAGVFWELGEHALPALVAAVTDEDEQRRAAATYLLGIAGRDHVDAAKKIAQIIETGEGADRAHAFRAAYLLGHRAKHSVRPLTNLLKKPSTPERERAEAATVLGAVVLDAFTHPPTRLPRPERQVADSIEAAQRWLLAHQDVEGAGGWSSRNFARTCSHETPCKGAGAWQYDVGVTGLAVLSMLPSGTSTGVREKSGPVGHGVRRALHFLMSQQAANGRMGSKEHALGIYNHVIATWALAEAFGRTRNPLYRHGAQRGIDHLHAAQNPYLGWRYESRGGDNDTSVTSWCAGALRIGQLAGLDVDPGSLRGALKWLDTMTEPEYGRTGYQQRGGMSARTIEQFERFPADQVESLTALALHARVLIGTDPLVGKSTELLLAKPPVWDLVTAGKIDMYYWMHGTHACRQIGGDAWKTWRSRMLETALASQLSEDAGGAAGSWPPAGPWGPEGGRVYSTAVMLWSMEAVAERTRRMTRGSLPTPAFKRVLPEFEKLLALEGKKAPPESVTRAAKRLVLAVRGLPEE